MMASLVLCNSSESFLRQNCHVWWKVKFMSQLVMTSSVVGLRRISKALPKAKLALKKVMVTVRWSAAGLTHYSFLNPSETITSGKNAQQVSEMRHKLQRLQVVLPNRKEQILSHDNTQLHVSQPARQRLNKLGYEVLPHPPYSPEVTSLISQSRPTLWDPTHCSPPGSTVRGISQARILEWVATSFSGRRVSGLLPAGRLFTTDPPDLWPTDYHFFKHLHIFFAGKHFHKQQEAENTFQKFTESWTTDFYAIGINISRWQKCVDCNGSYFD